MYLWERGASVGSDFELFNFLTKKRNRCPFKNSVREQKITLYANDVLLYIDGMYSYYSINKKQVRLKLML